MAQPPEEQAQSQITKTTFNLFVLSGTTMKSHNKSLLPLESLQTVS